MIKKMLLISIISVFILPLYSAIETNFAGTTYTRIAECQNTKDDPRQPFISLYGNMRAEPRTDIIALYFHYNIPTDLVYTWTAGTATATTTDSVLTVSSGTDTTVTTSLVSKRAVNYITGHEILGFFTAAFPNTSSSGTATQYIGFLTDEDGFAIGYQNSTFGILHRRNGSQVSFISQANFNLDPLDGSGNSGFVIDQTKINIYYIAYGWLGVAPIEFAVMREDGKWIPFHRIQYPNNNIVPSVYNPSLPLAIEITKSSSDSTDLQIKSASWNASITGTFRATRTWGYGIDETTISGTSDQTILNIRNKRNFQGKMSTITVRLLHTSFAGIESGNAYRIEFIKNATITNPSYSDFNSNNSPIEIDISGTVSDGTTIFKTGAYSRELNHIFFKENDIIIDIAPNETLSIIGSENGSGDITLNTTITWEEYY